MGKEPRSLAEMFADSNAGGGLKCPKCHCNNFETYKTQTQTTSVVRYKTCRNCGHKIITSTKSLERIVRDVDVRGDDESDEGGDLLSLVI